MKLLLDECVHQDFRHDIAGHDVYTVGYQRWSGIKNGRLLTLAAANGFDALVTTDRNLEYQQKLATLPPAIVVLQPRSHDLEDLYAPVPNLLAALASLEPRAITHVAS
jgi:hypothetical protein